MRQKVYGFLWIQSTGMRFRNGEMRFDGEKKPIPACGSDAVIWLDGRWSLENMESFIRSIIAQRDTYKRVVGYSIGYLDCYDPEDKKIQKILKYTAI